MYEKRKSLQELIDEYSSQLMGMRGFKEQAPSEQHPEEEIGNPISEEPIEDSKEGFMEEPVEEVEKEPEEEIREKHNEALKEEPEKGFREEIGEAFPADNAEYGEVKECTALDGEITELPPEPIPEPVEEPEPQPEEVEAAVSEECPIDGQLRVYAGDKYGRAIFGARVQICLIANDEEFHSAVEFSGTDGMTRLFNLPGELMPEANPEDGRYEVFIVANGFHPVRTPVEIIPGETVEKTILMRSLT